MPEARALVVDDDNLISWALHKALSSLRLEVVVAGTGAEALACARAAAYEFVFLDIHLPDANGLDLLREIKLLAPGAKIVMLSCAGTAGNRRRAYESGAWQFIAKPFELAEVVSLVRSALGGHAEIRRFDRRLCHLPLRIAVLDSAHGAGPEVQYLDATTLDVGAGGLRLHTGYPLCPGQWVRTSIADGEDSCAELVRSDAPAEVIWVVPESGGFTVGLRYMS